MANKNKGLGRGLSALFSGNEVNFDDENSKNPQSDEVLAENSAKIENASENSSKKTKFNSGKSLNDNENSAFSQNSANSGAPVNLPITQIDPNFEQPRKNFDEDALKELSESIKLHGIIQPLVVNAMGNRYMIIAGERRYRAAKMAGMTHVPAIIKNYSPQEVREISLIENLQREDLNPIEAAKAIKALMDEFGLTQDETAKRIGKNRSTIANTLRLLTLDYAVIAMVETGRLTAGHARALIPIEEKEIQRKFALQAEAEGLNVRAVENLVRNYLNPPVSEKKVKEKPSVELKNLVRDMQRVFATKVSCATKGDRGRIYIDFYSKDDLDRICELIESWKTEKTK